MCMQGLMKFHPLLLKILRKKNVMEGWMDGRMDGRENSITAHKHSLRAYNKGTDKPYVADSFIHSTTCHT